MKIFPVFLRQIITYCSICVQPRLRLSSLHNNSGWNFKDLMSKREKSARARNRYCSDTCRLHCRCEEQWKDSDSVLSSRGVGTSGNFKQASDALHILFIRTVKMTIVASKNFSQFLSGSHIRPTLV